jgi:molybdopterin-guanine dinucleotide biosynthesis protein A
MTFSAVLLAGGESRRMGRDKATLEVRGQPLWQRQLQQLRRLRPERVFISARTIPAWLPDDVVLLLDASPSRGPLSGLTRALGAIETTHVIVLAVDMPFMTVGELARLVEQTTEGRGVVPIIGDRAEPLAAIYPTAALVDFEAALGGSDFSLQAVVRTLVASDKVRLSPIDQNGLQFYRSVNQPSDLGVLPEFHA